MSLHINHKQRFFNQVKAGLEGLTRHDNVPGRDGDDTAGSIQMDGYNSAPGITENLTMKFDPVTKDVEQAAYKLTDTDPKKGDQIEHILSVETDGNQRNFRRQHISTKIRTTSVSLNLTTGTLSQFRDEVKARL